MSEKEKLRNTIAAMRKDGICDIKFAGNWIFRENFPQHVSVEDVCRDMNKILADYLSGKAENMPKEDYGTF